MKLKRSIFKFVIDSYEKSKMKPVEVLVNEINESIPAENIISVTMHNENVYNCVSEGPGKTYIPGEVWMEVYHRVEE